jgi:plastocyanin
VNQPLKPFQTVRIAALLLLSLLLGQSARPTEFYVFMTDSLTFDPAYLEIQFGDTVTWQNVDLFDTHNSVSDGGYWNSNDLSYGQDYSVQFFLTGTFPYRDTAYYPAGMTGTIVVTAPPPLLTNPARVGAGAFQFAVTNLTVGKTNVIQASTDLVNWTNLYTNITSSTGFLYTDMAASTFTLRRFYRAWVLP